MISLTKYSLVLINLVLILCASCESFDSQEMETYSIFYGVSLLSQEKLRNGSLCFEQLSQISKGLQRKERWALKVLDASGSPKTKLHWGNTFWLGSRHQCKGVNLLLRPPIAQTPRTSMDTAKSIAPFEVEYFGAYFFHNSSFQTMAGNEPDELLITLGLCLPLSCSEEEVYMLVEEYLSSKKLGIQKLYDMDFKMNGVKKIKTDYSWMDTRFYIFAFIVVAIVTTCLLSTFYDLRLNQLTRETKSIKVDESEKKNEEVKGSPTRYLNKENQQGKTFLTKKQKIFLCFSLHRNYQKLFDTEIKTSDTNFRCLFGIRSLMSATVIIGHFMYFSRHIFYNKVNVMNYLNHSTLQFIVNSELLVDSFFTIGGLLLGYFFLDSEKKKTRKSFSLFHKINFITSGIAGRFLRLIPTYMLALGFAENIEKWSWNKTIFWMPDRLDINCPKYWWRNVLFVNNFYPRSEMCADWTWNLACDMQLFIVTFSILVLTSPSFKKFVICLISLMIASNLYMGYLAYSLNYKPFPEYVFSNFEIFYAVPWTRIGPYGVGTIAGYLLRNWNGQLPFSKRMINIGWLMCATIQITLFFGLLDKDFSPINNAIYVGWCRTIWGLTTAWFVVACITNNAGFLTSFYSSNMWAPLSRVTFCVYMTHPFIVTALASLREAEIECEPLNVVVHGVGMIVLAFLFGFMFTLFFESPFICLTKILFEGQNKKKIIPDEKEKQNDDNSTSKFNKID